MAIIYIDKVPYDVKSGKNLLEACLSLGIDLPYFCWHPAMGSVGACRQCAVKVFKDEQDTRGRLLMSCMEPVRDNLYLSVNDPEAKGFRAEIIEWLMTNHPHDCAVCDEGGSCHLQDMTVMTGHNYRRFNYKKRTYRNQYLGPFINHEMNRCIQCYRCVRFYKDYAGGKDLDVFAAHDHVYFGRASDGVLENEFSGNLAEICPTGVFTDKTLKQHYTRKWDMTMAPSVCQHCGLGCNIIAAERYGELRQISTRFNSEVNGYFICDRGRFGYEFVNSLNRIRKPLIRGRIPEAVSREELFDHLKPILEEDSHLIGIGSPRASMESNFALMQLVGKENFYQGIPEHEARLLRTIINIYTSGRVHIPSLQEVEQADAILILGEDLINSAPRLALAVRQAVTKAPQDKARKLSIPGWHDAAVREFLQDDKGYLFIANPTATSLDSLAAGLMHPAPPEIARLGYAIARHLGSETPEVRGSTEEMNEAAKKIAKALNESTNPLVICGISNLNEEILHAAYSIAVALSDEKRKASLSIVVPECNSIGLAMTEAPSIEKVPQLFQSPRKGTLIVLENDLYRRFPKEQADRLLSACENLLVLDYLHNDTTEKANILIPAASFAEADGTLVNNEGRAQRFFQVFMPANPEIRESWKWLDHLRNRGEQTDREARLPEEILAELVTAMPLFKGAETVVPPADFRIAGQKIPREPHRYSGRTAMNAHRHVSEPKPPEDSDSPLSFTMEGFRGIPPGPLVPFFWAPGWNSIQSINKYQIEVGGPLHGGDPGKRLFDGKPLSAPKFPNSIPHAFSKETGQWQILPLPQIFGSEELSIYSAGISERSPRPYVGLNPRDANTFSVREGDFLHLQIGTRDFKLPLQIMEDLPEGCAALPYNVPGLTGIGWPAKGTIRKEEL